MSAYHQNSESKKSQNHSSSSIRMLDRKSKTKKSSSSRRRRASEDEFEDEVIVETNESSDSCEEGGFDSEFSEDFSDETRESTRDSHIEFESDEDSFQGECPTVVPTKGRFFLHDDRLDGKTDSVQRVKKNRKRGKAYTDKDSTKWVHDKFEELQIRENRKKSSYGGGQKRSGRSRHKNSKKPVKNKEYLQDEKKDTLKIIKNSKPRDSANKRNDRKKRLGKNKQKESISEVSNGGKESVILRKESKPFYPQTQTSNFASSHGQQFKYNYIPSSNESHVGAAGNELNYHPYMEHGEESIMMGNDSTSSMHDNVYYHQPQLYMLPSGEVVSYHGVMDPCTSMYDNSSRSCWTPESMHHPQSPSSSRFQPPPLPSESCQDRNSSNWLVETVKKQLADKN